MSRRGCSSEQGMSLLELVVGVAVLGVLMTIALPLYGQWKESLESRASARSIANALRDARSCAVSGNREHRVKFVALDKPCFYLQRGNLSRNSSEWEDLLGSKQMLSHGMSMRFTQGCDEDSDPRYISFNPDGSSNSLYICLGLGDTDLIEPKFAVGVSHSVTGRVTVLRWNPACACFE